MAVCALLACVCAASYPNALNWIRLGALMLIVPVCFSKRLRPILLPAFCVFLLFTVLYELRDKRPDYLPEGKYPVRGIVSVQPMDQPDKHRTA